MKFDQKIIGATGVQVVSSAETHTTIERKFAKTQPFCMNNFPIC